MNPHPSRTMKMLYPVDWQLVSPCRAIAVVFWKEKKKYSLMVIGELGKPGSQSCACGLNEEVKMFNPNP